MASTHTKCLRQSGRLSKSQQSDETMTPDMKSSLIHMKTTTSEIKSSLRHTGKKNFIIEPNEKTTTDIKSSLRHTGKKNYVEPDDDNSSDYCPLPKKRQRTTSSSTVPNISERKLSLRNKNNNSPISKNSPVKLNSRSSDVINSPSPKRKYAKRNLVCTTDRKLRNQTLNESECCNGNTELTEIKNEPLQMSPVKAKRGSSIKRLTNNSNCNNDSQLEHRSSKLKTQGNSGVSTSTRNSMRVKPKIIDHFNQSEEINIESSSASNLPKKSIIEPKKSNNVTVNSSIPSRKRSTLSQKHTDNNQLKLNGISYSNRTSISHHGKLCRKTKKTTIYHDSNGWILSKGYYSGDCDFWDGSQFDICNQKNVKTQQEIEIPSFREKKYTPLYKIEGTEDLSDHVFEKRHLQYEIMEKKIKKNFVMQSKYELQKSKYLKHNELWYKKESFLVKKFPKFIELNHDANNLKKIEIVPEVPVMAFGVPVKQLEVEEFQLLVQGVTE